MGRDFMKNWLVNKTGGPGSIFRVFRHVERCTGDFYRVKPYIPASFGAVFFAAVTAGAFILSDNIWISLAAAVVATPFFTCHFVKRLKVKKKRRTEIRFLEVMELVLAAVSAGNSVPEAVRSVCADPGNRSCGAGDVIKELEAVCGKSDMLYHFYDELMLFASKTESEDIIGCVKAMAIVGSRGGDMAYVIRNALTNLRIKFETDAEIEGALALPKYNLRIITVMPFALVLLVRSMSQGYMDMLYGTGAGIAVSVAAMLVIASAWLLGSRLCSIDL